MATIYCVDACSLIWAMRSAYPIEHFPGLWGKMSEASKKGILISTELVFDELNTQEGKEDGILTWASEHKDMFIKMDDATAIAVAEVIKKYPLLVDTLTDRNQADPYLIALAKVKNAIVVSEEGSAHNSPKKMKIPDVCSKEGIRCIKLLPMLKEFGWKFS